MPRVELKGTEQMAALGRRFKAAGDPAHGLRRELLAALRSAGAPLIKDAKAAARERLPKAGGLNERVANEPITMRNRLTGPSVGVRIVTTTTDTRGADRGTIRHPVYAKGQNRDSWKWVNQPYPAGKGWFTDTLESHRPEVTAYVLMVLRLTAEKITAKGL